MKLTIDKKLEKNLKLMRSCSQVRIIELTEKLPALIKEQVDLIKSDGVLRSTLTDILNSEMAADGLPEVVSPTAETLVGIPLPESMKIDSLNDVFSQYDSCQRRLRNLQTTIDEHEKLNEILSNRNVNLQDMNKVLNFPKTKAFKAFARNMREHSPIVLSLTYKARADAVAQRINIANTTYSTKSARTFNIQDTALSLKEDYTGRFINAGKKLVIGSALAGLLFAGAFNLGRNATDISAIETKTHTSGQVTPDGTPTIPQSPDEVVIDTSTKTPQGTQIFSNSIDINSYKTACEDFFQKTAEIYKYNTGEEINLSGYGQSNIGINRSVRVYRVTMPDGQIISISSQGHSASNAKYLEEVMEASGLSYTVDTTKTTCIIDKSDDTQSIAIVDASGNPVRSGNILVFAGNGIYIYNPDMVRIGSDLLKAKGISNPTEKQAVAEFLVSDSHNHQNTELSKALGVTAGLADTIKTTFYLGHNNVEDSYAIHLYSQESKGLAESFTEHTTGTQEQTQQDEHSER